MTTYVTATITAENTFTDTVFFDGDFNFSVSGTFANSAIITVQRSTDGSSWVDVDTACDKCHTITPSVMHHSSDHKTMLLTPSD